MSFDRNKPYGEIWGGQGAARFHQNGKYYDHEGNEVGVDKPANVGDNQAERPVVTKEVEDDGAASLAAALAEKRAKLLLQAIPLLEKAQGEVVAELPDYDVDLLEVMAEVEGMAKKRKTVLEAIAAEVAEKRAQADKDAAANGQVNAPTATFGTMGSESQLQNQLQG